MRHHRLRAGIGILYLVFTATGCQAQVNNADQQITLAVLPAPEAMRDGARVLGYDTAGALVELRSGTNDLTCIANNPDGENFHTSCYHASLEPFMNRGRELRATGKTGPESIEIRHEEINAGELLMPSEPAAVYNVYGGPVDSFNPDSAKVGLYAVYISGATQASTGLPDEPTPPGTPWIMRAGTPSAHIMIVTPGD